MRRRLGIILAALFYYSGLVPIAVWYRRLSSRSLIILNYHQSMGGDLRRHLLYFRRHYRVLHLEEALEELYSGSRQTKRKDRRTPMGISLDDGYSDNYMHAFVLARELQLPITVFIPTGYIENG